MLYYNISSLHDTGSVQGRLAMKASTARWLDPAAVALSGLCLVHCLALPLASLALPFLGSWAEAEWVHVAVIVLAAPLAALALRGPGAPPLLALAALGLACMLAAALGWPAERAELPLNTAGGVLVATAHALNWRRRHVGSPAYQRRVRPSM
jgi:hypothetical protein